MKITVEKIAELIKGKIEGDKNAFIEGPSKIEESKPGTITFLGNLKYEEYIYNTEATAVIVDHSFAPQHPVKTTLIKVDDVYGSLGKLLQKFGEKEPVEWEVSQHAFIDNTIDLAEKVHIGHGVFVGRNCKIGNHTVIMTQVYIGNNVKIGKGVKLYPGVRIYDDWRIGDNCVIHSNTVIGSDGFGFSKDDEGHYEKIPQLGNVIIENNVEIGSNTTIDRATIGSTVLRQGVKLDNLIQIGHNVEIGANTVIAAQTGIAGSTKIGKNCLIGGQVGIVGHISIADGTMIQAQSGIAKKINKKGSKLYGSPAIDYGNYLKSYAIFKSLPNIANEIEELRRQIANLVADQ